VFIYSVLPFVPLLQKGGVIFIFGPRMYFQTGQVIFVPEWPKGEFVSIIGLILFRKNHLYVKDVRRVSEDSACKSENLRFPVSRPDDRAIPSGRLSVHCSIHPDDVPYCPDARQTKHHPSK
jgi:hypothetical protein